MPRCVTNWEQRTLAHQVTAGKAMNIHGDGREERVRYAGIARSASYVTNQHPMFTRLLKHINGGDSIVYGEWSIARRELQLCK